MEPYYEDLAAGISIYLGDSLEIIPRLGETVDHVLTDPPFNVRTEDIDLAGRTPMIRDFGDWDEGFDPTPSLEVWNGVMRPGGSALVFSSDNLISTYLAGLFKPRGLIVWVKDNPAPQPRPGYVHATELIAWLHKEGGAATWNAGGYVPNVLRFPVCAGTERSAHPTQKPLALISNLMLRHTSAGECVLDPFAGTLTTAVASKMLGRRCIAIELDERWCEIGVRRLEATTPPLFVLPNTPVTEYQEALI